MPDSAIKAFVPQGKVGSNTFFKLDYNYQRFTAGVQFESFLPPIQGYFPDNIYVSGSKLVNKYFKYSADHFSIQIGDFYEQFGSGLILRAYENRQIGINNAIEGARIEASPLRYLKLKALYGNVRKFFDHSKSIVRAADAELDVTGLFNREASAVQLSIGGSFVNKNEDYSGGLGDSIPTGINSRAVRMDFSAGSFTFDAEYVLKSADPMVLNKLSSKEGKGFLFNAGWNRGNLGSTISYRTLSNMVMVSERESENPNIAPINFIPALTKQHDNLTSNIYVYNPQFIGESGLQFDVYYFISPGSKLGGKYGTRIAANYSNYAGLDNKGNLFSMSVKKKYYTDANLEIKKKWSKKLETTFFLQQIFIDKIVSTAIKSDVTANIVSIGALYKWAAKKSIRFKFEHLQADADFKSWLSGLTEFSFSSPYQFFISDLYNYGDTKVHYYNFGASYTKSGTRFALSYGRQREGLFCAGGVCRILPAANGFTASLTSSFGN